MYSEDAALKRIEPTQFRQHERLHSNGEINMAAKLPEVLAPSASLLCKLGSIIVHCDEFLSPDGHHFDKIALQELLGDSEVVAWISGMDSLCMLPLKRKK